MYLIELSETAANVLLNMYSDIFNLDARCSCSDASFRRHFMLLVKQPPAQDAIDQLKKAVNARKEP